ncbi:hypothetical protein EUTSA_v10027031mg [Eutrema salsugineum]|uniref:F-box domain-containing protein n=1 Tax=Eutrema salsugineum TaxID=72664 RepID=V4P1K6_EUTSA|nr:hypothetical protein EUTSA_v10027031mg [Eutrema salsugineum]
MSSGAGSSDPPSNKKEKKPSPSPASISILSLPHEVLLNCLARVSRLNYPTLFLVSKTFQSIISSSELYETRIRLNLTENGYRYIAVRIPSPKHMLPAQSSTLLAVGSNIYKIDSSDHAHQVKVWKRSYSSHVSVLDCRSHTWHPAPSMRMKRNGSSTATLLDGKMYVAGGCDDNYVYTSSPDWIEAFDLETQTWGSVKNPRLAKSLRLDGKLYLFGDEKVVYNPEEDQWNQIGMDHCRMFWAVNKSHCVIDDVLFYWDREVFKWYDPKGDLWKEVKGVEGLPDLRDHKDYCKMVDLGGKMGFLWPEYVYGIHGDSQCRIWCAEITLERRDHGDEIWGKLEWSDFVLSTDGSCSSFDVVSASV